MNVRFCFAKYGTLKFIGHLDVMRFFQKAVRRAKIDVVYSNGFHPHQIMSFASPLGVGLTSDREYMDIEVNGAYTVEEMTSRLNEVMQEGFFIRSCRELPIPENGRKKETAMSLITAADYLVSYKDEAAEQLDSEAFRSKWMNILSEPAIPTIKEIKKSGRKEEINLKDFIFSYGFDQEPLLPSVNEISSDDSFCLPYYEISHDSFAEKYENGLTVTLRLSAGSEVNIKPELVMDTFCRLAGFSYQESSWQVHRLELYTGKADALKTL